MKKLFLIVLSTFFIASFNSIYSTNFSYEGDYTYTGKIAIAKGEIYYAGNGEIDNYQYINESLKSAMKSYQIKYNNNDKYSLHTIKPKDLLQKVVFLNNSDEYCNIQNPITVQSTSMEPSKMFYFPCYLPYDILKNADLGSFIIQFCIEKNNKKHTFEFKLTIDKDFTKPCDLKGLSIEKNDLQTALNNNFTLFKSGPDNIHLNNHKSYTNFLLKEDIIEKNNIFFKIFYGEYNHSQKMKKIRRNIGIGIGVTAVASLAWYLKSK